MPDRPRRPVSQAPRYPVVSGGGAGTAALRRARVSQGACLKRRPRHYNSIDVAMPSEWYPGWRAPLLRVSTGSDGGRCQLGSIVNGIGLDGPLVRTLATTVTLCRPTGGLRGVNKLWFYTPSGGAHHPRGAVVTTNIVFMLMVGGAGGWFVGRWRAENARARFDQQKTWDARKNYRKSDPP